MIPARICLLASSALLATALVSTTATPAQAIPIVPTAATAGSASNAVAPVEWYATKSLGGKIRACYKEVCDWYYNTAFGDSLQWSHYAYNEFGNRWYYVDNGFTRGWIYCGNVTAGC